MDFPLHLQTFPLGHRSVSLFVPDAEAVKAAYQSGRIAFPYWSKVWPAAIGLSEFLLRHPHLVQNKKVAEAGAGLGLPSLVAAQTAASVWCTDVVPDAVDIVRRSAAHNGFENFNAAVLDWQRLPDDFNAEVLLLSDVNYEPAAFAALLDLIDRQLNAGTTVVLSTPQRLMAKEFVLPLLRHCIKREDAQTAQGDATVRVTVLVLQKQ